MCAGRCFESRGGGGDVKMCIRGGILVHDGVCEVIDDLCGIDAIVFQA